MYAENPVWLEANNLRAVTAQEDDPDRSGQ
ncbi:hypothetical protein PARHAE_03368 [Paracoccus haematequi]|uniref:Uncharacterized protein n=1 Tax=Paracoccus haematequi TaxID=2491866 RepID=A0A3S4GQ93_9RHOB|nr:hypothetical protein PARHAE_03368 [Paracoccus haematequi]